MNLDMIDVGSLGDISLNEQYLSLLQDDSFIDSNFFDLQVNNGPSLEESELTTGNGEGIQGKMEPAGDSVSLTRKRKIDDVNKSPDLRLKKSILFIFNRKMNIIIRMI
jgi:hypothetical protein